MYEDIVGSFATESCYRFKA